MKKFMSWLSISALLLSSLILGMGSAVADYDEDKEEDRMEEGAGGEGDMEGDDHTGEEDDWDDEEDDWEDGGEGDEHE
ncbi:hypothetical protein [Aquisalimonas sp.]|uniref:hypothetical protein n=1 Tax=unclassified Aquisalimonas TaxID=2644645 RepID=UPI0025BA998E|nr:hypothetical protein [Aquisalimonas sp.]